MMTEDQRARIRWWCNYALGVAVTAVLLGIVAHWPHDVLPYCIGLLFGSAIGVWPRRYERR